MLLDNNLSLIGGFDSRNVMVGQLATALGVTKGTNVTDLAPLFLGGNQVQSQRQQTLKFAVNILEQPTSGGAATVCFALVGADDPALTVNLQTLEQTDDFPISVLTTGKQVIMTVYNSGNTNRRYLGATINIGTAVLTNVNPQFLGSVIADLQCAPTMFKNGFGVA